MSALLFDFSIKNTMQVSLRSVISTWSPVSRIRLGISITDNGSVQCTSSRSPGLRGFSALRVFRAGSGHFNPARSSVIVVMRERGHRRAAWPSAAKGWRFLQYHRDERRAASYPPGRRWRYRRWLDHLGTGTASHYLSDTPRSCDADRFCSSRLRRDRPATSWLAAPAASAPARRATRASAPI